MYIYSFIYLALMVHLLLYICICLFPFVNLHNNCVCVCHTTILIWFGIPNSSGILHLLHRNKLLTISHNQVLTTFNIFDNVYTYTYIIYIYIINVCIIFIIIFFFHFKTFERFARYFIVFQLTFEIRFGVVFSLKLKTYLEFNIYLADRYIKV